MCVHLELGGNEIFPVIIISCYKACRILNSQEKKESLKSPSRAPWFTGTEEVWKAGDDKRQV